MIKYYYYLGFCLKRTIYSTMFYLVEGNTKQVELLYQLSHRITSVVFEGNDEVKVDLVGRKTVPTEACNLH